MTDTYPDVFSQKSVREDWVDLRDQNYTPNLTVLRDECYVDDRLLLTDDVGTKHLRFGIRNQGLTGRCAGFALANLVDIQRSLQFENRRKTPESSAEMLRQAAEQHYGRIVSADMLYRMGYFHDRYPDLDDKHDMGPNNEGLRTLRSVVKGFYHHGVCFDWSDSMDNCPPGHWQSDCYLPPEILDERKAQLFPRVLQAKEARSIGLGAYYRLASILNHFHAALNDAEAILVSANVHAGWKAPWDHGNDGFIEWSPKTGASGAHAFVIVGYDRNGFHVLNSVGPNWGGYKNQAGIGLWTYGDWAQNVIDSWVLRLGVHAPDAFGASIGEKGVKGRFKVQASIPCFELVGHYIHLDDGFHVQTGAYPSFSDGWEKTRGYLQENLAAEPNEDQYRGVLVWIPGSLEDIKSAFGSAVKRKNLVKALGLYPYSVFWCNGFAEKSMQVLTGLFDSCKEQAGVDAEHLDDLIEHRVRGVGRAFWRDIELSARRAVAGPTELPYEKDMDDQTRFEPGFVINFLKDLFQFVEDTGAELHLVTEGAGVLVLHEILDLLQADADKPEEKREFNTHTPEDIFTSVHLIGPAIGIYRAQKKVVPFLARMNANALNRGGLKPEDGPDIAPLYNLHEPAPAQIYIPTQNIEDRLSFGAYNKSMLHLISRAFEDRYAVSNHSQEEEKPPFGNPRTFLGMASIDAKFEELGSEIRDYMQKADLTPQERAEKESAADALDQARLGLTQIVRLQSGPADRIAQTSFDKDPGVQKHIFDSIMQMRAACKDHKNGD